MTVLDQDWKTERAALGSTYTSASKARKAELRDAFYRRKTIALDLDNLREVSASGAVGNIAANGGVLASDTTPILGAETTTEMRAVIWAATNVDGVAASLGLPEDFDGTEDCYLDLEVRTDNAGGGGIDAATFSVLSTWDNGTQVTDTATDATPSETYHRVRATIAAADIPDAPRTLSIQLVPAAHANDPTRLCGLRLVYVSKKQRRGEA